METRANYALIGLFALVVIASGFLFVFWVSGGGPSSSERTYKIVFTGSVAGLSRGAWVLFNGVRVGEVKEIHLMPNDPSHVYALIDVDSKVPIRVDTKARLASTALTGVASVALTGGSATAAPLGKGPHGGPGVIYAQRSDFNSVLEAVRTVAAQASDLLDKTNALLDRNSAAITASVKNMQKFSAALAANADGVKALLAAMTQVGKAIGPLSVKLSKLADDSDKVVAAVDPKSVKQITTNLVQLSAKLNASADKIDGVLTSLKGFFSAHGSQSAFAEVAAAAKSIHKLADDLDVRTKELTINLNRFAGSGLRQYEALAIQGRKTLQEIDRAVRSIEENPQQFIFGKSKQIPDYSNR